MDAQYPFASREDIWRVHEEVKDLVAMQVEHGERLSKLERRREDDTRIKNLWGPFSPFPSAVSTPGNQGKFNFLEIWLFLSLSVSLGLFIIKSEC